jgi:glycosyltransferase involved in cell wall biosynthesis
MPDEILAALHASPKARLNIAAVTVPASLLAAAARMPDQIRLLGFMAHLDAVRLQRRAHVLLNIANEDPSQVPGKFYEYLGAGRPILHLHNQPDDAISQLIIKLQRGWTCPNNREDISIRLDTLCRETPAGSLASGLAVGDADVTAYSWKALALRLQDILLRVAYREE